MKYKSEICKSEIEYLFGKVKNRNLGKYLFKIILHSIRGLKNETIQFDFPVTAIIAPNGGGKSTILGSAACAYKSVKPYGFFKNINSIDSETKKWKISYEIIDKEIEPKNVINKTIQFKNNKWERSKLSERTVYFFGISRTLPATERKYLTKCSYSNFESIPLAQHIDNHILENAARILGKDVSNYKQVDLESDSFPNKLSLLQGQTPNGIPFSEFHFGAGESNIIRLLQKIETIEENALILIEEIENGLHPIAQRCFVEYLITVAKRKKTQIIFTTHSNEALMPLPSQAIWACINNKLYQGKLDIKALRAINGETEASLAIFVEDEFAKSWIRAIVANSEIENAEDRIEIFKMNGDGNAVNLHKENNKNPISKRRSICILDGDSQQKDGTNAKIYHLPGQCPEKYIFDSVLTLIDNTEKIGCEKLCFLLGLPDKRSVEIFQNIKDIKMTNRDPHLLYNQIAERIGFVSEIVVINAFLNLWIRNYDDESQKIIKIISSNLS